MNDGTTQLTTKQLVALRRESPSIIDEYFAARQRQLSETLVRIKTSAGAASSDDERAKARRAAEEAASKAIERERRDLDTLVKLSDANNERREFLAGKQTQAGDASNPPASEGSTSETSPPAEDEVSERAAPASTAVPADEGTRWTIARFRSAVATVLAQERRALGKPDQEDSLVLLGEADTSWQSDLPDVENPTRPADASQASIEVRRVWEREHPYPKMVLDRSCDSHEIQRHLDSLRDVFAVSLQPAAGVDTTAVEFALMQAGIRVIPEETRERLLQSRQSTFILAEARGTRAFLREIRQRLEGRSKSLERIRKQLEAERKHREACLPKHLPKLIDLADARARSEITAAVKYSQGQFQSRCDTAARVFDRLLEAQASRIIHELPEESLGIHDQRPGKTYEYVTLNVEAIIDIGKHALDFRPAEGAERSSGAMAESLYESSSQESEFVKEYFTERVLKGLITRILIPGVRGGPNEPAKVLEGVRFAQPVTREAFGEIVGREVETFRRALGDVPQRYKVTQSFWKSPWFLLRLRELPQAILGSVSGPLAVLTLIGVFSVGEFRKAIAGWFVDEWPIVTIGLLGLFLLIMWNTRRRERSDAIAKARDLARKEFRNMILRIKDSWIELMKGNSTSEVEGAIRQLRVFLSPMAAATELQASDLESELARREVELESSARTLNEALKSVDAANRRIEGMADKVCKALCKEAQLQELPS
jgi:hypothetical protein